MTTTATPAEPSRDLLEALGPDLLDPLARRMVEAVQWWTLPGWPQTWPVAVLGEGPPLLMLHGFDSSFLEYRRLIPLLGSHHRLVVPDLHGFGFTPRAADGASSPRLVLDHLEALLTVLERDGAGGPVGVIGASMGGAVAVELARRQPQRIHTLLLLSPAGLTGRPRPLPAGLDRLGVWFLSRPGVRRGLCRQAFADPDRSVGPAEEQVASLHLRAPGWDRSLAAFARSGGFAGCGTPLPEQPLAVLWGRNDRILRPPQLRAARDLLGDRIELLDDCGHLPHLDRPERVAERWRELSAHSLPR